MTGNATLPSSAYLHVPFCTRRCSYCDFAVQAVSEPPTAEWLGAIQAELDLLTGERGWAVPLHLDTLYVGGGTPSLLGREAMDLLADRIRPYLSWDAHEVEWSCEANPESFSLAVAEGWRRAGVNRISLGVQTFHVPALRWMGRLHGPEGAVEAVRAARAAGFDNLSVDLIFGLPDHLNRDLEVDLARVLALEPEHVSLYGLTAEPAAPLGRWVAEGRERMPDEDRYADEFLLAHERLTGAGYRHYEVSNFARGDRESRHNRVYWSGSPYIGLGSGAHSYYPPLRRWNTRSWSAYRDSDHRRVRPRIDLARTQDRPGLFAGRSTAGAVAVRGRMGTPRLGHGGGRCADADGRRMASARSVGGGHGERRSFTGRPFPQTSGVRSHPVRLTGWRSRRHIPALTLIERARE
jgi:oxygen-independent coproporphyrinogen III oxidase